MCRKNKAKCGEAGGNVELWYRGGCKQELDKTEAYRCTGCGAWFHLDCIQKHFEEEKAHDTSVKKAKREGAVLIWNKSKDSNRSIFEITEEIIKENL